MLETEYNARALPEHAAVEAKRGTATGYSATDMYCVMHSSFVALLVWWDEPERQVSPLFQKQQWQP
jgi:ATP-dependent phosphoenolpyruvate carboxykinase